MSEGKARQGELADQEHIEGVEERCKVDAKARQAGRSSAQRMRESECKSCKGSSCEHAMRELE